MRLVAGQEPEYESTLHWWERPGFSSSARDFWPQREAGLHKGRLRCVRGPRPAGSQPTRCPVIRTGLPGCRLPGSRVEAPGPRQGMPGSGWPRGPGRFPWPFRGAGPSTTWAGLRPGAAPDPRCPLGEMRARGRAGPSRRAKTRRGGSWPPLRRGPGRAGRRNAGEAIRSWGVVFPVVTGLTVGRFTFHQAAPGCQSSVPMTCETDEQPNSASHCRRPSQMVRGILGSRNRAVPTARPVAPARRNSAASVQ